MKKLKNIAPFKGTSFWRHHKISLLIILGLILATAAGLGAVTVFSQRDLEEKERQQAARIEEIDKKIAEIEKRKIEEAAQKKAEEERIAAAKKAEEEAAQKAAEEAAKRAAANQAPVAATNCAKSDAYSNPNSLTVVVNKQRCFNPITFTPTDLVTLHGATVSAKAQNDFNSMMNAAAGAGVPLTVSSSYRSYQTQISTYNYWVRTSGQAGADLGSARPGHSEHQTGLTIDLTAGSCGLDCFKNSGQYTWMRANAAQYGFIERYIAGYTHITGYRDEPWHWRYVGPDVAQAYKASGVQTLEQYYGLPAAPSY